MKLFKSVRTDDHAQLFTPSPFNLLGTVKPFNFLLAILLLMAKTSLPAQDFRTDINPALLYYQAQLLAPAPLSSADSDFLFSREGREQPLPERFAAIVSAYDNQFTLVRQAAASTLPCDWGIDLSRGPETLMPGFARCKAVTQAARLRVMWELQHDQQTQARDDLLAAFTLARNCARDGTLIAVLVQIANEAIDCTTISENFGWFSPETLKQVIAGIDTAPVRTTIADAVPVERASFIDWMIARILNLQKQNPGDDARVMTRIRALLTPLETNEAGKTEVWSPVVRASGGTSGGVLKLLREEAELYQRLAAILALPPSEYDQQLKQFTAEVNASSNPLVSATFPSFEKARNREIRIQVWLAMVRSAGAWKLNGDAGFQSVSDPISGGPFEFQRFVFEGMDRGFRLKSAYTGSGYPETLIFVEKPGPGFRVDGPHAGEPLPSALAAK